MTMPDGDDLDRVVAKRVRDLVVKRLGPREARALLPRLLGPGGAGMQPEVAHLAAAVELFRNGRSSTPTVNRAIRAVTWALGLPEFARARQALVDTWLRKLREVEPEEEARLLGMTLEERQAQLARLAEARAARQESATANGGVHASG